MTRAKSKALGTPSRITVRARPDAGSEEVEEDAEDGEGRDGEDHADEPAELPAADHGQEHDDRMYV